ncbi:MAG: hypothetical protein MJ189_05310 [Coriobacteriales bacterium]|nr:hypothetical protein [Coriobacteriales bacterium]
MIDLSKFEPMTEEEIEEIKKTSGGQTVYFLSAECSSCGFKWATVSWAEVSGFDSKNDQCPQCGNYTCNFDSDPIDI